MPQLWAGSNPESLGESLVTEAQTIFLRFMKLPLCPTPAPVVLKLVPVSLRFWCSITYQSYFPCWELYPPPPTPPPQAFISGFFFLLDVERGFPGDC